MCRTRCVQQTCSEDAAVVNECFSVVLTHRRSSTCESLRQDSEQTGPCHPTEVCPPLHCFGPFPVRLVGQVETFKKRRAQPLAKGDSASFLGHGNPVGFHTARWAPSIDSSVATNRFLSALPNPLQTPTDPRGTRDQLLALQHAERTREVVAWRN